MISRLRLLGLLCTTSWACAQTWDDLVTVRNPQYPYSQLLQFKAGMLGAVATDEDPAAGLDSQLAVDGHAFYHDEAFGSQTGQLDAYAGRDGLLASVTDGRLVGGETRTRLELKARLWPFYREGFYRDDAFVPVGRYEGRDYEGYLGFGREASPGLFVEFGAFYGRKEFERNDDTAANYVIPGDYDVYGGRIFMEQGTVQLDRRTGLPQDGFILTLVGEREWNDSEGTFGVVSGFESELPSAVWRARGRIEWYLPQSDGVTWEIFANGRLTDEQDRVVNSQAEHPQGDLWVDAQVRLRFHLGDAITLSPFAAGQYLQIVDEAGTGSDNPFFYGGGFEGWLHFSDALSLNTWYSYLNNESRPSVSISEDVHGEHMFFAGMVLRFGGTRR